MNIATKIGLNLIYPENMGIGTGIEYVNGLTFKLYHIYWFPLMAAIILPRNELFIEFMLSSTLNVNSNNPIRLGMVKNICVGTNISALIAILKKLPYFLVKWQILGDFFT